ncbi:LANO_0H23772g1_1 [Lachancea nothofagi CBS 11611]|uniref:LANO_0H23772g1_1 n=1 Tax=Lachancea nothofagi CBS 11611 TaxID=1266666 RepID=A0A1G4KNM7_9SACH|nr:LANO_0H23772g1_1 [Lachancea nothofagi CBS 11611]
MDTDVRYTFLDALDHLPSDLIRSLWTIQGLELREDSDRTFADQESVKEAQNIQREILRHHEWMTFQTQEMQEMADIQARYQAHEGTLEVKSKSAKTQTKSQPKEPLKIKINLKPSHSSEPVYCVCREVSYGAMIACDNLKCPTEWFHYTCVGLTGAPNGKWYCSERCHRQANKKKFMNL